MRSAAESSELANLVTRAMHDLTGLEPGERYRVDMYLMCWLQNAELALLDHSDGLLPDLTF